MSVDTERVLEIFNDFRKRMMKNGATNKARWNAFTSMPSLSPVQLTRRLNQYGITVTNQEVSALWKFVGIKTNSLKYEDFVRMLQMDPSEAPQKSAKRNKTSRQNAHDDYEDFDDYQERQNSAPAVSRPRLGRHIEEEGPKSRLRNPAVKNDGIKKGIKSKQTIQKNPTQNKRGKNETNNRPQTSKPHVTIDSRFLKKPGQNYEEDDDDEQIYQRQSRYKNDYYEDDDVDGDVDDERENFYQMSGRRPNPNQYQDDDDDEDEDEENYSRKAGRPNLGRGSSHARPNKSGVDDAIMQNGTYDSADEDEDDYTNESRNYRRTQQRPNYGISSNKYENDDDLDEDGSSYENQRQIEDDDDIDEEDFNRNSRYMNKKASTDSSVSDRGNSNDPEIFSRIPSSNSPKRTPPSGARGRLDPTIFGNSPSKGYVSPSASSRSSTSQQMKPEYEDAEQISGVGLKKLISMISEHVYNAYPNSKTCYHKWRGMHNGLEAGDLRDGLAKDGKILISLDDAQKIISKYGGPLTLSTFARLLSDGTRFKEEADMGPPEITEDEEAIFEIAEQVSALMKSRRGQRNVNQWEEIIYRAPDIVDIVRGFEELGIDVSLDSVRVLTAKLGKAGLVKAIKSKLL
ncbi:hypothetical protein TRFO_09080 [Tritrichomonas foetus]|uniref:Uncharacterized protein n=1 Tax=Tritrichomonas foetus TaxID=1144522 RepID=A0A1J4JIN8_9EUKA|nr:hypothetical protein TRFO_09080 [Tritrichomonas foetus]|eukprot:OHS98199.1 hypothetical protein TRFO_09080 [Tritrichomonas foetus]